jgi:threonine/homoserine/homoserine lactone efflux protein
MLNGTLLLGFVVASLIVLVIPGQGVLYVVAQSALQGYRAGLISVLGLAAGASVHVVGAAIGLSAILFASSTAFGIVKTIGAAYLIYLGLRTLLSARRRTPVAEPAPQPLRRLFRDGVIVSIFNPKVAIFFLAFLPQFVDPTLGSATQQILLLGMIYIALAILSDGAYALLAGGLRQTLARLITGSPVLRTISGSIYVALGINAALLQQRN